MRQKHIVLAIIISAWILIPTGTPDDILTFFLIGFLGKYYFLLIIILFILFLKYDINLKKIKRVLKTIKLR